MPRRTKIVATLGPATDDPGVLDAILRAGVDVARINFSHGSGQEHLDRVARLRDAAARVGKVVAVLADLPGPKLRVKLATPRQLTPGDTITFSSSAQPSNPDDLVITEPELLADVRVGQKILLDDGRFQLAAGPMIGDRLTATVVVGGTLSPNKGLNLPETELSIGAVTARDRIALEVAAKAGADWLAVSFVRGPEAAAEVRAAASEVGWHGPILAKVERPEAVRRAAAVVAAFDAIMVARGDLGVEMPLETVPTVQKRLIAEARAAGKPVITATDMLDSMRTNPRPTRAEASDVANAIFDGTDAVMLSGETAVGSYPLAAVQCMARIAEETESQLMHDESRRPALFVTDPTADPVMEALAHDTVDLARKIGADAIVSPTLTGRTARSLSKHRPSAPVIAAGPSPEVLREMAVIWGVTPILMNKLSSGQDRLQGAIRDGFSAGVLPAGSLVVVLAGHPIEAGSRFPTIRIVRVGAGGSSQEP